jgi:hypothetical protein
MESRWHLGLLGLHGFPCLQGDEILKCIVIWKVHFVTFTTRCIPLKLTSEEKDSQFHGVPFDPKSREAQEICSVNAHRRITNRKAQIMQSCGEPETWSTQHIVRR